MLIDATTGNLIDCDLHRMPQRGRVVYKSEDILCFCFCEDDYRVVLKHEFPELDNLVEPKLLYRCEDIVVVNPQTGPSIIICDGVRVHNTKWRALFAYTATFGNLLLVTDEWVVSIYEAHNSVSKQIRSGWEHKIPDLKSAAIMRSDSHSCCLTMYWGQICAKYNLNHECMIDRDWAISESSRYWDCECEFTIGNDYCRGNCDQTKRDTRMYHVIEPTRVLIDKNNMLMLAKQRNRCVIIDTRTNEAHERRYSDALFKLADGCADFALNSSIIKFYQHDGSVIVDESKPQFVYHEDNCLPKPKRTNTKSARSG